MLSGLHRTLQYLAQFDKNTFCGSHFFEIVDLNLYTVDFYVQFFILTKMTLQCLSRIWTSLTWLNFVMVVWF